MTTDRPENLLDPNAGAAVLPPEAVQIIERWKHLLDGGGLHLMGSEGGTHSVWMVVTEDPET
jgi:hypothetical protein